jgi:hypothetical protein
MRGHLAFAVAVGCLVATQASAQTATAVGTGVGVANSNSRSNAVAVSGQGGTGGSAVINNPAQPAVTTQNLNQNVTGTSTVKNVPAVFAPGLTAAGLETCLGSISGGGAVAGFGMSFGTTIPDPGCAARLDARTLWAFGLRRAAIARLCLQGEIYKSMPEICSGYVAVAPAGYVPAVTKDGGVPYAENYSGGPIEVIDQKGNRRICNDLDVNKHRCRAWAQQMAAAH